MVCFDRWFAGGGSAETARFGLQAVSRRVLIGVMSLPNGVAFFEMILMGSRHSLGLISLRHSFDTAHVAAREVPSRSSRYGARIAKILRLVACSYDGGTDMVESMRVGSWRGVYQEDVCFSRGWGNDTRGG